MDGARRGEPVLYVTLSETEEELRAGAESHGWVLDGIEIRELTPREEELDLDEQNTMFHPSEVELASITKLILEDVERLKPTRVVFDSLSELRLLAGSPLRYRRQILALKQFFATRQCTVLLLDDLTAIDRDLQVQSIAHGVVLLEQLNPEYGSERRRLRVVKYRGVQFRGGYHDYVIKRGGIEVFPRLVAAEHRQVTTRAKLSSEIEELDALLGGGHRRRHQHLDRGRGGHGQVDRRRTVCVGGRTARPARGDVPVRRESADTAVAVRWVEGEPRRPSGRRSDHPAANRSGRTDAGRVRATGYGSPSSSATPRSSSSTA